jgi:hypothetical protein
MSLLSLPEDILEYLRGFLDTPSQARLARTSKSLHRVYRRYRETHWNCTLWLKEREPLLAVIYCEGGPERASHYLHSQKGILIPQHHYFARYSHRLLSSTIKLGPNADLFHKRQCYLHLDKNLDLVDISDERRRRAQHLQASYILK